MSELHLTMKDIYYMPKEAFYNLSGKDFVVEKYSEDSKERDLYVKLCMSDHRADANHDNKITYGEYLKFLELKSIYQPTYIEKMNSNIAYEPGSLTFNDKGGIMFGTMSKTEGPQKVLLVNGQTINCKPGCWLRYVEDDLLVRAVLADGKEQLIKLGKGQVIMIGGKMITEVSCMPGSEIEFHDNKNVFKFTPTKEYFIPITIKWKDTVEKRLIPCKIGKEVIYWPNGKPRQFFASNGMLVSLNEKGEAE